MAFQSLPNFMEQLQGHALEEPPQTAQLSILQWPQTPQKPEGKQPWVLFLCSMTKYPLNTAAKSRCSGSQSRWGDGKDRPQRCPWEHVLGAGTRGMWTGRNPNFH